MYKKKDKPPGYGEKRKAVCGHCHEVFEYKFLGRDREFCGTNTCSAREWRKNSKKITPKAFHEKDLAVADSEAFKGMVAGLKKEKENDEKENYLKSVPAAYRDVLTDDGEDLFHENKRTGRKTILLINDKIQIIADYSQNQNFTSTGRAHDVSAYVVKTLVERNPRMLKYFEDMTKAETLTMLNYLTKSSLAILAKRMNKDPNKFTNDELSKLAAMTFDKARLEEGKPEKIIMFDSMATMQANIKNIRAAVMGEIIDVKPKEIDGPKTDESAG